MFIHVPGSTSKEVRTSWHSREQVRTVDYVVKKLISCDIQPTDIMVLAAYRAEFIELRKTMQTNVIVTTADSAQMPREAFQTTEA